MHPAQPHSLLLASVIFSSFSNFRFRLSNNIRVKRFRHRRSVYLQPGGNTAHNYEFRYMKHCSLKPDSKARPPLQICIVFQQHICHPHLCSDPQKQIDLDVSRNTHRGSGTLPEVVGHANIVLSDLGEGLAVIPRHYLVILISNDTS
jgi:hypothetical protein